MDLLRIEIRQALRRLLRAPWFTAIAVIMLAIGLGATTAIFSVVEGVLLKPLPYPKASELIDVGHTAPGIGIKDLGASPSTYFTYREHSRTFQDIGIYSDDFVSVTGSGQPEQVAALSVTDGVLPILGVKPMIGRRFTSQDDSPASADTVMMTYGYWQRRFGGDRSIVGRSITVNGKPRVVIGVMPRQFDFLDQPVPSLILPMKFDQAKLYLGNFSFQAIARLKPGATLASASADVAGMLPIVNRSFPSPPGFSLKMFLDARIGPNLRPLKSVVVGNIGRLLWVLMGGIGMVLLIACANVANLLLVKAEGREQELAIRSALGASRLKIAAGLLIESLVLGLAGGALGLAFAYGALRVLIRMAPAGLPRASEIGIDGHVLLFALAATLFASLLFGLAPILKYARGQAGAGLRAGGRSLSQTRQQHRARSVLVAVQVALALVLLVSSGLMIRSFRSLSRVTPGFIDPEHVQTFRIAIPEAEVKDPEQVVRLDDDIGQKIAALPGVDSVGFTSTIPMDGTASFDPIFIKGRTLAEGRLPPVRRFVYLSPEFLRTMGTPLVAGREITWTDIYNKLPVALISENLAREYWHNPSKALGERIRVGSTDDWREIVGVVADVHDDGLNKPAPAVVYWPFVMKHFYNQELFVRRNTAFVLRSPRTGSASLMREVEKAVWSADPNLPLAAVHTLGYFYAKSMARTSFTLVMLALAGCMALLLGVVGIYGVTAYAVSQRTREIGIRMALGAQQRQLVGMFVMQGIKLAVAGIACGIVMAVALTRLMTSLLFGVKPLDALTLCVVSFGLLATAVLASYAPSRRAAGVNPVNALRAE
ncbi:MAG: ABC transporter permease [Acidobacteriota bacterium]|nr:ABC transporter permease [Acidobacteriota bacterium]